jgi:uncharacterized protein (UPF0333 family)
LLRKNNRGQGSAEYLLLFGGIIVFAIAALLIYYAYFTPSGLTVSGDMQQMRNNTNGTSEVMVSFTNNGAAIVSSLRYEVYSPDGSLLAQTRVLSGTSSGTFNLGSYPKGSTIKFHESLNGGNLPSPITTNIVITVTSNGKNILNWPIIETVQPNTHKGASGNWQQAKIV